MDGRPGEGGHHIPELVGPQMLGQRVEVVRALALHDPVGGGGRGLGQGQGADNYLKRV